MIYRISEYHGIELRKYRLPIKHVVVYLGAAKPKMRTKLKPSEVLEGFMLVNVRGFAPEKWLNEKEPSKVIMAVLGDYQKKNAKLILTAIFKQLRIVCKTDLELKKYVKQLILISRMRNLEQLTIKISEEMPITIDIEKDYLYKLGLRKAEELLKKAKEAAFQSKKQVEKIAKEKAAFQVKAEKAAKEKATLQAKVVKEKAMLQAKIAKEKAIFQAKAAKEKAALQIKAKTEKKDSIRKMQALKTLSDAAIREILHLDKKTYQQYIQEMKEEKK